MPRAVFLIDKRERPGKSGWYEIAYDPADQFVTVHGRICEAGTTST